MLQGRTKRKKTTLEAAAPRVVIISGLSGSGKTVALRAVEDLRFFCVDNLPVQLIGALLARTSKNLAGRDIAIGIDIRDRESLPRIGNIIRRLRTRYAIEILFLEAEPDVLARRFKETRRPHPLGGSMEEAIASEQKSLEGLRELADRIVDTSSLSPHELRKQIFSFFRTKKKGASDISIALMSFGFKYGTPQNADLLFDVRFIPNPYFVPALRDLNGLNPKVAHYVLRQTETGEFMKKIRDLLAFLVPLYIREGKSYLSVAFGCTGGNHRSPAIVEKVAELLRRKNIDLSIVHRDIK